MWKTIKTIKTMKKVIITVALYKKTYTSTSSILGIFKGNFNLRSEPLEFLVLNDNANHLETIEKTAAKLNKMIEKFKNYEIKFIEEQEILSINNKKIYIIRPKDEIFSKIISLIK